MSWAIKPQNSRSRIRPLKLPGTEDDRWFFRICQQERPVQLAMPRLDRLVPVTRAIVPATLAFLRLSAFPIARQARSDGFMQNLPSKARADFTSIVAINGLPPLPQVRLRHWGLRFVLRCSARSRDGQVAGTTRVGCPGMPGQRARGGTA